MRPYPLFKSPEDPSSSLLVGIVSGKLQKRVRLPLAECASRQIRGSDCSCPTWSAQEGREIYNLFATFAVPRIYISDADGIIRAIFTDSPVPTYEDMETAVLDLLQE